MKKTVQRTASPKIDANKKPNPKLDKFRFFDGKFLPLVTSLVLISIFFFIAFISSYFTTGKNSKYQNEAKEQYWFVLYRASNLEQLFKGVPGDTENSRLIRTFKVKSGIPGERPTPLPQLLGREYWTITKKFETSDNPETAPYFLQFDVPGYEVPPYGPVPYEECNGQCNWELEGPFGMHGVDGDPTRLDMQNPGSSGCVRHLDADITYLYNIINPEDKVRYYIQDI